jgi:hypothetical protein
MTDENNAADEDLLELMEIEMHFALLDGYVDDDPILFRGDHRLDEHARDPDAAEHPMVLAGNAAPDGAVPVLRDIVSPHANDVICGRGNRANFHNRSYRALVEVRKAAYRSAENQREKIDIATEVVNLVRNRQPSGRFLKLDPRTRLWYDIGFRNSLAKVVQALREEVTAQGNDERGVVERTRRQPALEPVGTFYKRLLAQRDSSCSNDDYRVQGIVFPEPHDHDFINQIGGELNAKRNMSASFPPVWCP